MKNEYEKYIKKYLPDSKWDEAIKKLNKGISPQYIVGNVNFYGNIIKVDDRVLIPRFETELLVEKTILYIKKIFRRQIKILDIGTGSGCIAISLKKETGYYVCGCDISGDALDVAKENSLINNVDVKFVKSDVFSNIKEKFDVIISNPPYLSYAEEVEEIVKNNEPHLALYAEDDGLYFYDKILSECFEYLNNNFLIAFEIGYRQGNIIKDMAFKYLGDDIIVSVEKDLSDRDRFIFIYNK